MADADHVDAERDQRIEVVVERIAERRREQHRAGRAGLMMIEHDGRETTRDTARGSRSRSPT